MKIFLIILIGMITIARAQSVTDYLHYSNPDETCNLILGTDSKGNVLEFTMSSSEGIKRNLDVIEDFSIEPLDELVDEVTDVEILAHHFDGKWKVILKDKTSSIQITSSHRGIEVDENNKPISGKTTLKIQYEKKSRNISVATAVSYVKKGKRYYPSSGINCEKLTL